MTSEGNDARPAWSITAREQTNTAMKQPFFSVRTTLSGLLSACALLAFTATTAQAGGEPGSEGPDAASRLEIQHLIEEMRGSECRFYRNGIWYGSDRAARHIESKYEKLQEMGAVNSTEQFIARAASESSMSGKPYRVRCGDAKPVPSGEWFNTQLREYREAHPAPVTPDPS